MDAASVLGALAEETRYALFRALAAATRPVTATDLADRVGLHANTVRMHLERMREAGVVTVDQVHRGTVGRPQHVYSLAAPRPEITFDPAAHALLAGLLAGLAERVGADSGDAVAIGRAWGRAAARNRPRAPGAGAPNCALVLAEEMDRLGFEPDVDFEPDVGFEPDVERDGLGPVTVAFLCCPFRDLAEAYPELVCGIHRGICEGITDVVGLGTVDEFTTMHGNEPCQVSVSVR